MNSECDLVLKSVMMPDGLVKDISVKDGLVVHSGSQLRSERTIDCTGYFCIPGATDMHVHMRGGEEQSYKETWESGSKSALAGGVTTVIDQPNTIPPVTDALSFSKRRDEAKSLSYCNFGINGGVSPGCDIKGMYRTGAVAFGETFFAESSYGKPVNPEFLAKVFGEILSENALVTVHAEKTGPGKDNSLLCHEKIRSCKSEAEAVREVLDIAPEGLRIHMCHLSSPESVRAVLSSKNVTFEVMPHHLFLSTEMFEEDDGLAKVNPPVRHEDVRKAIWGYWDKIDVIASDHAPHTFSEKTKTPFSEIPSGIPGVETMLPLLLNEVAEKRITLKSVIEKTVYNPSRILGIKSPGFMKNDTGDFAVYPKNPVKIRSDILHSKAGWTPYEGMNAIFPEYTIIGGNIAYEKGEFHKGFASHIPGKGYIQ
ncbi:dihydroorotase [Methanomicrobium sp. W14]|uniref:dihydroorotase n=1 Tax=Methanomicrobium sp. W14 TaxID=2817839 RepID=UPI001AE19A92|nr:dihydroorotase [Methanomicrobium sp. W14]MBP2132284.1 dihydroorotase [Methanomicrobium sp. W14]